LRPAGPQLAVIDQRDVAALPQCHRRCVVEQIAAAFDRFSMHDDPTLALIENSPQHLAVGQEQAVDPPVTRSLDDLRCFGRRLAAIAPQAFQPIQRRSARPLLEREQFLRVVSEPHGRPRETTVSCCPNP